MCKEQEKTNGSVELKSWPFLRKRERKNHIGTLMRHFEYFMGQRPERQKTFRRLVRGDCAWPSCEEGAFFRAVDLVIASYLALEITEFDAILGKRSFW